MNWLQHAETWLAILSLILTGLLLVRIWTQGLHLVYRYFSLYLLVDLIRSGLGLALPTRSDAYTIFYFVSTPLMWIVYLLVLIEMFELVLRDHPGVATAARWVMASALLIAGAISFVSSSIDFANQNEKYVLLRSFLAGHRIVLSTLALALLLLCAFLAWFPVILRRNIFLYCLGFSVTFLAQASLVLLRNLLGNPIWPSALILGISCLCLSVWIWKLNHEGEERQLAVGHRWNREEADRLMRQLDEINSTLVRVARR